MYWDSSALVPLVLKEDSTQQVQEWLARDYFIATWAWSRVEITSAIERRVREGTLLRSQRREALRRLVEFADRWYEVTDLLAVRSRASSLLARHALRAMDAGQLGAALIVKELYPGVLAFACLDHRLSLAAELENLQLLD